MRSRTLESRAFISLAVLTTGVFLWMIRGFLIPVFWAVVLAVLFRPVFVRWLNAVRGRAGAAAVLTTLTVVVVIMVPFALLVAAVAGQALGLYEGIISGKVDLHAPVEYFERSIPALSGFLAGYGIDAASLQASIESTAITASRFLATQAIAMGQGLLRFGALFGLMLYVLFFFFRDWDRILDAVVRALPLGDDRERRLARKFAEISRATMKGTVLVAAAQGAIGGALFAIVGIDAAIFWGVMMAAFSLLPVVGTFLIWGPAAIMLIASGSVGKGLIVIAGGVLVIGLVDNVLRPILVGHETKIPDYLILLSTLGGLTAFGASGVVIGPFVAGLCLVIWEMMTEEYGTPAGDTRPVVVDDSQLIPIEDSLPIPLDDSLPIPLDDSLPPG